MLSPHPPGFPLCVSSSHRPFLHLSSISLHPLQRWWVWLQQKPPLFTESLSRGGQGKQVLSEGKCWLDASQSIENQACVHSLTHDPVTLLLSCINWEHVKHLLLRSQWSTSMNVFFVEHSVFMKNAAKILKELHCCSYLVTRNQMGGFLMCSWSPEIVYSSFWHNHNILAHKVSVILLILLPHKFCEMYFRKLNTVHPFVGLDTSESIWKQLQLIEVHRNPNTN